MNYDLTKTLILSFTGNYLEPDKTGKGFVCPICGSGSGKHGTGITTKDGIHFTCWRGCYTSKDIIDIIGLKHGLTDYREKLEKTCEEMGISLNHDFPNLIGTHSKHIKIRHEVKSKPAATDYREFYVQCTKNLYDTDYLLKRGISFEVQQQFEIGYCAKWQSPTAIQKGYNPPTTPRMIIPTSPNSYVAIDVRPREDIPEHEKNYVKVKEGKVQLFNLQALQKMFEPIFVVEGEVDALSIIEIGHSAISLGSVSNYKKLIAEFVQSKPPFPILIALDNDESGRQTSEKLLHELQKIGVECYEVDINNEFKDSNEHLVKARESFKKAVNNALKKILTLRENKKINYVQENSALKYLREFIDVLSKKVDTTNIATGFKNLDTELDGGLYEGLYVIGAISSLGKTTFCLQMADNIAKTGNDVLIFSLEMARNELIAKSLSRLTAELTMTKHLPISMAKSLRGITKAKLYENYTIEERNLIDEAIKNYETFGQQIYILEGIGNIGVNEIRNQINQHIQFTGKAPVVIVDYLQILAPSNERATDKQNTDKAVLELKRISRDYKIPVLGISSFNRENYNVEVSMQAFKESGAIEYSSDVLIGLQLYRAGSGNFNVDEERKKNPRQVELKILKNRNGKVGGKILLEYYPQFNYFKEIR